MSVNETQLRHWLSDYLASARGGDPAAVDLDCSFSDLGLTSRDAVVISGGLSELLGRPVSPVEFWQHSTPADLVRYLTTAESATPAPAVAAAGATSADEPIAVIGAGCRLPGDICGPEALWQFLEAGRSAVGKVPPDRWSWFDDGSPETAAALAGTTRWGSFLADISAFDADFFDVPPREVEKMDPQQRLLLEVVHEALEHAGLRPDALRQTQTGVFVGACATDYGYLVATDLDDVDAWSGTGGALSIIANRLSYFFDWRGPSVTVDTACSSSLVAVHLACQSLRSGEANLAVAGGVNILLSPAVTRSFDQAGAMSATGACHAFDATADGFVRGEGAGVVVLKRLTEALRDRDRILAVVRGSAVNQDGRSNGLMAPSPAAQIAVLRAAYRNADIAPREVDYVETHGTGTLLGDPIEARALGTVLGRGRPADAPLLLGAVKSNLGHLEAAAGVTGFIKAVLAVQRGRVPANVGFTAPNPHIRFAERRLKVVAEHTAWPSVAHPRRAGVSSFGFGGTNAHIVIEQAPVVAAVPRQPAPVVTTLVVSGKTGDRVAATASMLADWMTGAGRHVELADIAHTVNHHRGRHAKFATVTACDRPQAVAGLRALAEGYSATGVVGVHAGRCRPGTVFVYSGQGSQWAGMGRQLLADEPIFAAAVAELEPVFVEQAGFSLQQILAAGEPVVGIDRVQPVLVGLQLALTELWRGYGVEPDAVLGHSMGEVSAAVVAGALTRADGLKVIATRSRLMASLSGCGAMALLELEPADVEQLIAGRPGVTVAVHASPRQTVIAGPPADVDAIVATVESWDRLARRIDVEVASHNPIVDPLLPELRDALADLNPGIPRIPLISTSGVTPAFDADYWAANLRNPVQFHQAVTAAGAEHGTFIEISPHPVLTHTITDNLTDLHHHSIPTLARNSHDTLTFHTHLNATHTTQPPHTPHPPGPHPDLPTTPWHHTHAWCTPRRRAQTAWPAPQSGTVLGRPFRIAAMPAMQLWQAKLSPQAKPYPGCHRIQGVEVVPVSVLLETVLTAAAEFGASGVVDARFEHPIVLDQPRLIQVSAEAATITISSIPDADFPADTQRWLRHVTAELHSDPVGRETELVDQADLASLGPVNGSSGEHIDIGSRDLAEVFAAWGVEGPAFPWSLGSVWYTPDRVAAEVRTAQATSVALLDAAIYVGCLFEYAHPRLLVPAAVRSVRFGPAPIDATASVRVRRRASSDPGLVVDISVTAPNGRSCIEISSLRYVDMESANPPVDDADPRALVHAVHWRPRHRDANPPVAAPRPVAVVGDDGLAVEELRDHLAAGGHPPAGVDEACEVIYLAAADPAGIGVEAAVRSAVEVTRLLQRLAAPGRRQPARLWVVSRGVREATGPAALGQSGLWGITAVAAAEQPDLWGGLVDIPAGEPIGKHAPALAGLLGQSPDQREPIQALAGGEVLVPVLAPISGPPAREPLRCLPDAAYLITGGMGALGLLAAGWLAEHGARRLVLAGRTALPPRRSWDSGRHDVDVQRKIAAVRALERRGVTVDIAVVDIGSSDAVRALLTGRDDAGAAPIRGVIHAAGITADKLLTETTETTFGEVLWSKVGGAAVLHELFPPGELDFFFLTSSAGAVFGVPGQGAYAAANAYLDCLARFRHSSGDHTLSLDWVAWQQTGFAAEAPVVLAELERMGSRAVRPSEAFAAWEYVHRYGIAQAVIAPMPSDQPAPPDAPAPARQWSAMPAEQLRRELEAGLRVMLARELGIPDPELTSQLPFVELGVDSMRAMSIRREIERFAGIKVSATILWNHPTLAALATYLAEKIAPSHDPGTNGAAAADGQHDSGSGVLEELFDSVDPVA